MAYRTVNITGVHCSLQLDPFAAIFCAWQINFLFQAMHVQKYTGLQLLVSTPCKSYGRIKCEHSLRLTFSEAIKVQKGV